MKINVRPIFSGKYIEATFEDGNATIESGLLDETERAELAETLRKAADELCSDDVPYEELEAAWKRDQALQDADDSKLPALPEGRKPKLYDVGPWFDEDEMREYARAAIAAAREA